MIPSVEYLAIGEGDEVALDSASNQVEGMDIGDEEGDHEDKVASEYEDANDDFIKDASSEDDEEERLPELEVTATGDITECSVFGGATLKSMC